MANTIRASKNTFNGGLVMDLSPDNTPNEVLTSALNATLVTFNGNELLLLNDMGNGRVETARLPDGYIPVGTCEFGDIIYIVSYNPLTNRSQIGCFPSPERNISSEEKGSTGQILTCEDFLEMKHMTNLESSPLVPTGELKANSVRKVLYNDKLNPGDKYIIYDKNNSILGEKYVSDIGNTSHVYGAFPKLLKIHVVAIEDSGKINYLDSTLRWYNHEYNDQKRDYFIIPMKKENGTNIPDIDSYRNLLSSGYSVFQSKISGKLSLLIELEKITGFSCTYNIYTTKEDILTNDIIDELDDTAGDFYSKGCKVYWSINWNTLDNNINPAYIVLTNSEWVNKNNETAGGVWKYWKYDDSKNTVELNYNSNINNLPIAFPNDGYWYSKISRFYNPTFEEFIKLNNHNNIITYIRDYSIDEGYESSDDTVRMKGYKIKGNDSYGCPHIIYLHDSDYNIAVNRIYTRIPDSYSYPPITDQIPDIVLEDYNLPLISFPITYKDFIENSDLSIYSENISYNVQERQKIKDIKSYSKNNIQPYKNVDLIKLNICRIPDLENYVNLPDIGKYYINLATLEKLENSYIAKTEYIGENSLYVEIEPYNLSDDFVNNYFKTSVSKYFYEFIIPTKQIITINDLPHEYTPNIDNLIYHYEITPAMDYGLLREYSMEGYIDFSRIGTGDINLTLWKYFNTENSSTLSIGIDAYVEENKDIAEVVMEFYDNQGFAAAYHINNKSSYSGTFTEFIPLNNAIINPNLDKIDSENNQRYHLGAKTVNISDNIVYNDNNKAKPLYFNNGQIFSDPGFQTPYNDIDNLYINDAGILYSNALYLVKIVVKYCLKDSLGNLDTNDTSNFKTFYRWFWTNTMFNDYYSNIIDYNLISFDLNLDMNVTYSSTDGYKYECFDYSNIKNNTEYLYSNAGATVQTVGVNGNGNIKYSILPYLNEDFNTFSLRGSLSSNTGIYQCLNVNIFNDCDQFIKNIDENPGLVHTGSSNWPEWEGLTPIMSDSLKVTTSKGLFNNLNTKVPELITEDSNNRADIWETNDGYKNLQNGFLVNIVGNKYINDNTDSYISHDSNVKTLSGKSYVTKVLGNIESGNNDIKAYIVHYSKYYCINNINYREVDLLRPLLRFESDLNIYNLSIGSWGIPFIRDVMTYSLYDDDDSTESHVAVLRLDYSDHSSTPYFTDNKEHYWDLDFGDSEWNGAFGGHSGYFWREKPDDWKNMRSKGFFLYSMRVGPGNGCCLDPYNNTNMQTFGFIPRRTTDDIGGKWRQLYGIDSNINIARNILRYGNDYPRNYVKPFTYVLFGTNYIRLTNDERTQLENEFNRSLLDFDVLYNCRWTWDNGEECAYELVGIGYNGDENDVEHYFNTFFVINGVIGNNENKIYKPQHIEFGPPYNTLYPLYIGLHIATILCGLYKYEGGKTSIAVPSTSDIIYLSNNYTEYTKDIVYKIFIDTSHGNLNDLLLIRGILYSKGSDENDPDGYLECIINNSIGSDEYKKLLDSNKISNNNVNLKLRSCIKNFPILFKLNYINPDYNRLTLKNNDNVGVLRAESDGWVTAHTFNGLDTNALYWIDENGNILIFNSNFNARYVNSLVKIPTGTGNDLIRAIYTENNNRSYLPNLSSLFKYNGWKLICKNIGTGNSYLFAMHGWREADMMICDIRKDEVLLPLGNIMLPENIPI